AGLQHLRVAERVENIVPRALGVDDPSVTQQRQVLGDIRLGDADPVGELADRGRTRSKRLEQQEPLRIRKRLAKPRVQLVDLLADFVVHAVKPPYRNVDRKRGPGQRREIRRPERLRHGRAPRSCPAHVLRIYTSYQTSECIDVFRDRIRTSRTRGRPLDSYMRIL